MLLLRKLVVNSINYNQVVHITIEGLEASGFPINDYLTRSIDGYNSFPETFPNF
jgi:hypothetical protein